MQVPYTKNSTLRDISNEHLRTKTRSRSRQPSCSPQERLDNAVFRLLLLNLIRDEKSYSSSPPSIQITHVPESESASILKDPHWRTKVFSIPCFMAIYTYYIPSDGRPSLQDEMLKLVIPVSSIDFQVPKERAAIELVRFVVYADFMGVFYIGSSATRTSRSGPD